MNVRVLHRTLDTSPFQGFNTGTILEISQLRDQWNRERILILKNSLEKLINPNQTNEEESFQIEIIAEDEKLQDQKEISEMAGRSVKLNDLENTIEITFE